MRLTFLQAEKDDDSVRFLNDPIVKERFANAKKLSEVNVDDYAAVFFVGGHGPVIDLSVDPVNKKMASEVNIRRMRYDDVS